MAGDLKFDVHVKDTVCVRAVNYSGFFPLTFHLGTGGSLKKEMKRTESKGHSKFVS